MVVVRSRVRFEIEEKWRRDRRSAGLGVGGYLPPSFFSKRVNLHIDCACYSATSIMQEDRILIQPAKEIILSKDPKILERTGKPKKRRSRDR